MESYYNPIVDSWETGKWRTITTLSLPHGRQVNGDLLQPNRRLMGDR